MFNNLVAKIVRATGKFIDSMIATCISLIKQLIQFIKEISAAVWNFIKDTSINIFQFFKKIVKIVVTFIYDIFVPKKGFVEFTTGKHEIFIKVKAGKHKKVWIHISDQEDYPGCSYLDRDLFSVSELFKHGFVIVANVASKKRKVYWYIK